MQSIHDIRPA